MNIKKEFNELKADYQNALHYVVYNGPPNTIYNEYRGNVNTEYGLIEGVKVCNNLYKYVINPSEEVTIAHIQYNGFSDLSKELKITKDIASAMIKYDHKKYVEFEDMFNDNDLVHLLKFNPDVLRYIKKQTYQMCCDVIKNKCWKSQSRLFTELLHGGVGLWHENINESFVECFNLECFDEKEIMGLYGIMFQNNKNSIKYMRPKYITLDMVRKYVETNPEFLQQYTRNFPEHSLSSIELKIMYQQMVKKGCYNYKHVDAKYQTHEMIDTLMNDTYGVAYYRFINNIEEIGEKIYLKAFENNFDNIRHIPNKYITFDMCDKAVKYNRLNIAHVPDELQTLDMCRGVAMKDYSLIQYCEHIDLDMLQSVNKQCVKLPKKDRYNFINNLSDDKIINILKIMPHLLRDIDKYKLKDSMIRISLETDGYALEHVDAQNQTDEFITIALKNQPKAEKYIKINNTII